MAKKATAVKKASPKKPRIVAATGSSASSGRPDVSAKAIQQAMQHAITKAMEDGVSDPNQIRERILAAREAAKQA